VTNPEYTHYILLVDRTASMKKIRQETEEGVRRYIREQAALPGKATLSLCQFDAWPDPEAMLPGHSQRMGEMITQIEQTADFAPIGDVPEYVLDPRGNTPLYDAIGITATREGVKLAAMPEHERPGTVIYVIVTDGENNWSREWSLPMVNELLTQQRETYGWGITFLGANIDSAATADAMGIPAAAALDYSATSGGTQSVWRSASAASTRSRSGGGPLSYSPGERSAAKDGE